MEENSEVIWFEKDEYIEKPFPEEHSCRLKSPDDFTSFARQNCQQRHDDKCIDVIFGIKEGKSEIQALRYPKDVWTAESARAHCKDRGGSFEAASKDIEYFRNKLYRAFKDEPIESVKELMALNEAFVLNTNVQLEILLNKSRDQLADEESGDDAAISLSDTVKGEISDHATATSGGDEAEIIIVED